MLIPQGNRYSWYVVNPYSDVESSKLVRMDLSKDVELRHDLSKGRIIVLRDKSIESSVKRKHEKIGTLKKLFVNKRITTNWELRGFVRDNKDKILEILGK
jgi:hypothetical protein